MNNYTWFGMLLGLSMFFPQWCAVMRGRPQNLASWLLWWMIAMVSAMSIRAQNGNSSLPFAYCFGDMMIVCAIIRDWKSVRWTRVETTTLILVVGCIVAWKVSGPKAATIMATVAHLTAGMPQLIDSYRKPWNTSALVYLGFATAGLLSMLGGKDWSVEQRLYPFSTGLYCISVSIVAARKLWVKDTQKDKRF